MGGKKVKALSLFSGIGGFEVGMAKCGFRFLKTLEWDENCCITLNANPDFTAAEEKDIKPLDITKVQPSDFWSGEEPIDYIVGGPPCQSFSAAGRRVGGVPGTSDTRGTLFWFYCQYVKHFRPKAFVFENVRGILASKQGEDFRVICASFEEVGYKLYWRVLNAADYGVPQQRERVFLVGIRNDIKVEFRFPRPTHGPDSPDKTPFVTCRQALKGTIDENEVVPPYGGKYGDLIPAIPPGENYRFYTEEMGNPNPLFAWRSKFSNFLYKMNPDDLCRTIIAYQGRYDGPFHWHNRKCTVDEIKRLQGFPADYSIPQKHGEGIKQVGNSVCPPVATQIGRALRYQIEGLEEFKVPLLEPGEQLTFDKRKGVRARQSRNKKVKAYNDIVQPTLFDTVPSPIEYVDCKKDRVRDGIKIKWAFKNGDLKISIRQIAHTDKDAVTTRIKLNFFGSVVEKIHSVQAISVVPKGSPCLLNILWDEIHIAVKELTSYESLIPLFGHFTEPYPKFRIEFESDSQSDEVQFQKAALIEKNRLHILPYDCFPLKVADVESFLLQMREYGFDVRNSHTNRAMKPNHFRICYPFVMPIGARTYTNWK